MSDIGGVISDCIITYYTPHRGQEMDPISPFLMQSSLALINRLSKVTEEVGYRLRSFVTAGFLPVSPLCINQIIRGTSDLRTCRSAGQEVDLLELALSWRQESVRYLVNTSHCLYGPARLWLVT